MLSQNHFPESNRHMLEFFSSILTVQDYILSTAGDARSDVIDVLGVGDDVVDHVSSKDTVVI
jgi:hypothetical protein